MRRLFSDPRSWFEAFAFVLIGLMIIAAVTLIFSLMPASLPETPVAYYHYLS